MERTKYYLVDKERSHFFFLAIIPIPRGAKDILDLRATALKCHPLSTNDGIELAIEVLFSYRVLLGAEEELNGEERKDFHSYLAGEVSLLQTLFSLELEIGSLYAEAINIEGLITSLGVELEIRVQKKILKEAPTIIYKRFLLKGVEREVQQEVFLEREAQKGRDWGRVTSITATIKECKGATQNDRVLVSGEVELGIYYLDARETLFLCYQDHPLHMFLEVEGALGREDVEISAYLRDVSWKDGESILFVSLIISLRLSFSSVYPQNLPVVKREEGQRLYLKAILEEGGKGFLFESEVTFEKGSPLKIKRVVADFALKEKRRLHRGIFFQSLVEIAVYYIHVEGALIWETFSLSYRGEIPTTLSQGKVEIVASMKDVLWEPSSCGLSLIVPLEIEYFLTQEAPYYVPLGHDGFEVEALEYLGRKKEILFLSSLFSPSKPLQVVERIEAKGRIKKALAFSGRIYLEGRIEYQVYYLTRFNDEQSYFSFEEAFEKEYVIEGMRRDYTIQTALALQELEHKIDSSGRELKVLSFWEVDCILCREGRFSLSIGEEKKEGLCLEREGEEGRFYSHSFKGQDLPVDLETIEGAKVEVLQLETIGSRVLFSYRYLFSAIEIPLAPSSDLCSAILLPINPNPEDLLLVEGRILWVGFSVERDHLQTVFYFQALYRHFTKDG